MKPTVKQILRNAAITLSDYPRHDRWPLTELAAYFADGLLEAIRLRPDVFTERRHLSLTEGVEQSADPQEVYRVLTLLCNTDSEGEQRKRAITQVPLSQLDRFDPDWREREPATQVDNVAADAAQPHRFWCLPPNNGKGHVLADVVPLPPTLPPDTEDDPDELASYDMAFPAQPVYAPAITYYIVYRCMTKDTDFAQGQQRASLWYEKFLTTLGMSSERGDEGGDDGR